MPRRIPSPLLLPLLALAAAGCAPVSAAGFTIRPGGLAAYPDGPATPVAVGRDTVTVLPRGVVAFPLIRRLVDGARSRVDVEMYELGRPDLLHALVAAHDRGVAVTVVDDPSVDMTAAASAGLRAAGVDVVDYPVRTQMIDHVKLLVVDARVAVVGGINWGPASAANHDFDAEVEGPAASNLERVMLRDLVTAGRQGVVVPPELPDRDVEVTATLPFPDIRPRALGCVEDARHTLDLELYVLTDVGIVHAIERARARGVRVRALLDPTQRPSDPAVAELRSAGVDVRLYRGAGELLHAKACTADRRTVVFGSANWSSGGFARNHEVDLALPDAPAVAATFTAAMDADWAASS